MSEQTKQSDDFSKKVYIGEWIVYDIGNTTVKDLYSQKIINKHTNDSKITIKRPDALIVAPNKEIVVFVESKDDGKLDSEKQIENAIKQELLVAQKTRSKIYILRDSNKNIWINPLTGNQILNEDGTPLNVKLSPAKAPLESEKIIKKVLHSISESNDKLLSEVYLNPTDLATQIHQKLFITKGVSPSTALYTFVEMFIFKYLSDIGVLVGKYSFDYLLSMYSLAGMSEIDVLKEYLSNNGARHKMKELFPEGKDRTTIINGNIFHEEIGDAKTFRSIMETFKKYEIDNGKFININKDFKSKLFESFLKQDITSKKMGQFFTPLKIVDNMVRMVDIKEGMSICDPACGVGKFLLEAIEDYVNEFYKYKNGKITKKIKLTGYDKYSEENGDKTIILAKANALIYFSKLISENPSIQFTEALTNDFLNETFELKYSSLGTLEEFEMNKYDLILANPPYIVNGSRDVRDLAVGFTWGGLGIEALFIEWIVKALRENGIANIVIPDGILRNINNKKLKDNLLKYCYIESIISLPIRTFFNTPKKTYILTIRKKANIDENTSLMQDYPVFTYICKSIGESLDVDRFDKEDDNDLETAVNKYNIYKSLSDKAIVKNISYINDDKQFKALDITEFTSDKSWIIENWWTEEEKITIGLKKARETKSIDDFIELLDDTIDLMNNFKEELECMN